MTGIIMIYHCTTSGEETPNGNFRPQSDNSKSETEGYTDSFHMLLKENYHAIMMGETDSISNNETP